MNYDFLDIQKDIIHVQKDLSKGYFKRYLFPKTILKTKNN